MNERKLVRAAAFFLLPFPVASVLSVQLFLLQDCIADYLTGGIVSRYEVHCIADGVHVFDALVVGGLLQLLFGVVTILQLRRTAPPRLLRYCGMGALMGILPIVALSVLFSVLGESAFTWLSFALATVGLPIFFGYCILYAVDYHTQQAESGAAPAHRVWLWTLLSFPLVFAVAVGLGALANRSLLNPQRPPRPGYESGLRSLGLGVAMYSMDHADLLPESLGPVIDLEYTHSSALLSPADKSPMVVDGKYPCSYHFVGTLNVEEVSGVAAPERFVIAYERPRKHAHWRACLFIDGSARMVTDAELKELLAYDLSVLKGLESWQGLSDERKQQIESFYSGAP